MGMLSAFVRVDRAEMAAGELEKGFLCAVIPYLSY